MQELPKTKHVAKPTP